MPIQTVVAVIDAVGKSGRTDADRLRRRLSPGPRAQRTRKRPRPRPCTCPPAAPPPCSTYCGAPSHRPRESAPAAANRQGGLQLSPGSGASRKEHQVDLAGPSQVSGAGGRNAARKHSCQLDRAREACGARHRRQPRRWWSLPPVSGEHSVVPAGPGGALVAPGFGNAVPARANYVGSTGRKDDDGVRQA